MKQSNFEINEIKTGSLLSLMQETRYKLSLRGTKSGISAHCLHQCFRHRRAEREKNDIIIALLITTFLQQGLLCYLIII